MCGDEQRRLHILGGEIASEKASGRKSMVLNKQRLVAYCQGYGGGGLDDAKRQTGNMGNLVSYRLHFGLLY